MYRPRGAESDSASEPYGSVLPSTFCEVTSSGENIIHPLETGQGYVHGGAILLKQGSGRRER